MIAHLDTASAEAKISNSAPTLGSLPTSKADVVGPCILRRTIATFRRAMNPSNDGGNKRIGSPPLTIEHTVVDASYITRVKIAASSLGSRSIVRRPPMTVSALLLQHEIDEQPKDLCRFHIQ